ncbi:MAG: hypothetical protein ACXW2G_09290 [Burkholderiaceae bacterium]
MTQWEDHGQPAREVQTFRERAPTDPKVKLVLPPGYDPAKERPAPAPAQSPAAR